MSSAKSKIAITLSLIVCAVVALVAVSPSGMATAAPAARPMPMPANAPVVNSDGTVTFSLRAPGAAHVYLNLQNMVGASPAYNSYAMTANASGVWSITLGPTVPGLLGWTNPPAPLAPDWYGYGFNIDGTPPVVPPVNPTVSTTATAAGGVNIPDPANRDIWSGSTSAWSYVFVPGPAADFMADAAVPHGVWGTVRYFSNVEQTERQMQVYTPPGYGKDNRRYPVLYIMHGTGGNDTDWPVNMRANYIMDNLIAQGKAVPMIVVMPDGNVGGSLHYLRDFPEELMGSIIPAVEENFRTAPGPKNRALAGLSRGGRWTMATLVKYPGYFAYVGVLAANYDVTTEPDVYTVELLDNPAINKGTKLLWITVGDETDISYARTHATLALLDEHGVNHTFVQGTGGHVWGVWRQNLYDFAPLLFK